MTDTDHPEYGGTALFCGSRTYTDSAAIDAWLKVLRPANWRIVSGAQRGADKIAALYARLMGFTVDEYPADWDSYGKRAGYIRNQQMLDEGKPDVVLAFVDKPLAESKGTAMMVDLAHKAGVPVYVMQYIAPPATEKVES